MAQLGVVAAATISVLSMKYFLTAPCLSRTIGRTSVVFLKPLALNDFGKSTNMAPFPFLEKLLVYVPVIKAAIMRRGFICISSIGVISGTNKLTTTGTFASRNDQRALEIELQNVTSAKYWATTRSHLDCATTCALVPTFSLAHHHEVTWWALISVPARVFSCNQLIMIFMCTMFIKKSSPSDLRRVCPSEADACLACLVLFRDVFSFRFSCFIAYYTAHMSQKKKRQARRRQEEGKEKARKRQECRMAPRKVAPRRSLLRGGKVIVPGAPGSPCERIRQGARRSQAEARNKGRKVHFASLTDICHLKNSELEPRDQKYKGRVVLRGDIVKDVSGSYAVIHWTRIVSVPNESHKSYGLLYPDFQDVQVKQPMQYTLISGQNGRCINVIHKFDSQNVQIFGYVYRSTKGKNHAPVWKTSRSSRKGSVRLPSGRTVVGKAIWESSIGTRLGKVLNRECLLVNRARGLFPSMYVDDIKLAGKNRLGNFSCKTLVWENQHHFLTMDIWVALKETAK